MLLLIIKSAKSIADDYLRTDSVTHVVSLLVIVINKSHYSYIPYYSSDYLVRVMHIPGSGVSGQTIRFAGFSGSIFNLED